MSHKVLYRCGIGEVAAPLACDAQLASGLVHLLYQDHLCPLFGGGHGSHHAGGTGSNHNHPAHDFDKVMMSAGCTQSTGNCELCTICWALVPRNSCEIIRSCSVLITTRSALMFSA